MQDSSKYYPFNTNYGNLTTDYWNFKWEIKALIKKWYFKEFMPTERKWKKDNQEWEIKK